MYYDLIKGMSIDEFLDRTNQQCIKISDSFPERHGRYKARSESIITAMWRDIQELKKENEQLKQNVKF